MDKSNSSICLKYTLITVNILGIGGGIAGFITGLAKNDVLLEYGVSGAQLALFSLVLVFVSFIGLIGALRDHFYLLIIYGSLILLSFAFRVLWSYTMYWNRGETFILDANPGTSIMSVFFALFIIVFAAFRAYAIRNGLTMSHHQQLHTQKLSKG